MRSSANRIAVVAITIEAIRGQDGALDEGCRVHSRRHDPCDRARVELRCPLGDHRRDHPQALRVRLVPEAGDQHPCWLLRVEDCELLEGAAGIGGAWGVRQLRGEGLAIGERERDDVGVEVAWIA